MRNESETRELIIKATDDLLNEARDVKSITVREVAHRANVSVGLINYYFRKKSTLLNIAVSRRLSEMAIAMKENQAIREDMEAHHIRSLLKSLYTSGEKSGGLIRFLMTHEIFNGNMDVALYLVPMLKEEFNFQMDEIRLRIIILQILLPIQAASINPPAFYRFTGIELHNVQQRENIIDVLVDNLLNDRELK